MSKTVADAYPTEVGAVRDAVTAFENAAETYVTEDLDQEYDALGSARGAAITLEASAERLRERLSERQRELEV